MECAEAQGKTPVHGLTSGEWLFQMAWGWGSLGVGLWTLKPGPEGPEPQRNSGPGIKLAYQLQRKAETLHQPSEAAPGSHRVTHDTNKHRIKHQTQQALPMMGVSKIFLKSIDWGGMGGIKASHTYVLLQKQGIVNTQQTLRSQRLFITKVLRKTRILPTFT